MPGSQPSSTDAPLPVAPSRRRTLDTITLERPRCPHCRGIRLHKYRSLFDQGDGSAVSWVRCMCGHRFKVVME